MSIKVDYLVIGAGPAGVRAAEILSKTGKKTAIVGKTLGGSFCYDGRVVLSSLLYVSSLYDKYKQVMQFFTETQSTSAKIDFKRVKKYVESVISRVCKSFNDELEKTQVEYICGSAEFTGRNSVAVTKSDGIVEEYIFDKCIVAVGASDKKLDILSSAKSLKISTILNFESVPSSVVIIGGGLVGSETAAFFSRLGSKVTILEKSDRILNGFDQTIVKKYEDFLKKKGIDIVTGYIAKKIERIGQKYVIFYGEDKLESEEVFVCIGRKPLVEDLHFDMAGVVVSEDGIPNFYPDLKTDNPDIYLEGDVTGVRMRSGLAFHSASVAAKNILGKNLKYNSEGASAVLSVDPEISCVGLTEEEAKKNGYDYGVFKYTAGDIHRAAMPSSVPFFAKVIYDKENKSILGIHAIGKSAIDIVSDFSIIIQSGMTVEDIVDFISAKPLVSEFISELAEKLK
ncbi:MAG: NAD(P)/FAD-dependent oxidoreductase [Deferribacterales bacterium]|nr:NAD(P)/FAD-dependent oxidoreductase [Deferribacterales bacterium]